MEKLPKILCEAHKQIKSLDWLFRIRQIAIYLFNETLSSSPKHRTVLLPHWEWDVLIHNESSFSASPWKELHSSCLAWYSSSWEMLEVQILHCHLVTTRPCQSGLTHQGFLHLTKSIYFSSIEGDISRGGLSDIHNFWIEKIVILADRGFSWIY